MDYCGEGAIPVREGVKKRSLGVIPPREGEKTSKVGGIPRSGKGCTS